MKKDTKETDLPGRAKPRRLSGTWVQVEGGKGGANGKGMTVDAGTRCKAQIKAADDGGGRGCTTFRWMAFHSGRGGGEWVRHRV